MKSSHFARLAVLFSFVLAFASPLLADGPKRPNIVFLLADDMRHDDLSFLDSDRARTPHLDELAAEGVHFSNARVTTAICVVSRVSILTGQYARRHGIYGFRTPIAEEAWRETYPMALKREGYRTGFVGKYGVNIWVPDEQKQYPSDDFDYWFVPGPGQKRFLPDEEGRDVHYTQMLGRKAIEFLRESADEPFCLSLSFLAPHGSLDPNPAFESLFADDTMGLPRTFGPEFYDQLPEPFRVGRNFGREKFVEQMSTHPDFLAFMRTRKNKTYGLDLVVGAIRLELERLGVAENTIVIFSSDHGYYSGEHGINGKWWMHEESVRTPMIVHDPRLPSASGGRELDPYVLNIDIAPTILEYAGAPIPDGMQGRSMKPFVDGRAVKDWREDFFYEQHFDLSTTKSERYIPPVEGVVGPRFKYVNYFQDEGAEELFDILEDPNETNNLVDEPSHRDVLARMRDRYEVLKKETR